MECMNLMQEFWNESCKCFITNWYYYKKDALAEKKRVEYMHFALMRDTFVHRAASKRTT